VVICGGAAKADVANASVNRTVKPTKRNRRKRVVGIVSLPYTLWFRGLNKTASARIPSE